jgi:hypothetical protein
VGGEAGVVRVGDVVGVLRLEAGAGLSLGKVCEPTATGGEGGGGEGGRGWGWGGRGNGVKPPGGV